MKHRFLTFLSRLVFLATSLHAAGLVGSSSARAYPSFIGYGYTSCIVCHFNAFGNGPLTDYGRALGATAIAAKPFFAPDASDETLGEQSGFLGSVEFPDFARLSADYRGLLLASQVGKGGPKRYVTMQADVGLVLKAADDKLIFSGTIGYAPPGPGAPNTPATRKVISREHYLSYAVDSKVPMRLYAGFMDVVYGIRTPDHIAFSRTMNKIAQNDQVHGVAAHWGFPDMEVGAHVFLGNIWQNSKIRPKGVSGMIEYDLAEKVRFGGSALVSTSEVRNRRLLAVHMRAGVGEGSSAMFELGLVNDAPKEEQSTWGSYVYTQTMVRLTRGVHFLFTGEFATADTFKPSVRYFRVGPAIQYFPMQRLEIRADVLGSRSLGSTAIVEPSDDFSAFGQVHLWF